MPTSSPRNLINLPQPLHAIDTSFSIQSVNPCTIIDSYETRHDRNRHGSPGNKERPHLAGIFWNTFVPDNPNLVNNGLLRRYAHARVTNLCQRTLRITEANHFDTADTVDATLARRTVDRVIRTDTAETSIGPHLA